MNSSSVIRLSVPKAASGAIGVALAAISWKSRVPKVTNASSVPSTKA